MSASASLNPNYVIWFNETYASRNYGMTNGVYNGWPWTRLGYTYDWVSSSPKNVELSEFVVPSGMLATKQNTPVPIEVVTITDAATCGK